MMGIQKKGVINAYWAMAFVGLSSSSASLVLPLLREQYALSYDVAGMLLAFLSVGNLIAALLSGILPRYLGIRKTAILFTGGMLLGYGLMSFTGAPVVIMFAFLLVGLAKGSGINNATVVAGNAAKDRTRAVNLVNAMFAIGGLSSPLIYMAAGKLPFWQAPVAVLGALGGIFWLLYWTMNLSDEKLVGSKAEDMSFLKKRRFWYSTALLFGQQCADIGVTNWLVTYFKDQGILTGVLGELTVTVLFAGILVGRVAIGFFLPQNSRFRSLVLMSAVTLVAYLLLLGVNDGVTALIFLFLYGLGISGVYPTAIAQANQSMSNATVGVMLPIAGIGAILMPYMIGAVAQRVGIHGGMMCAAASMALMLVFALLLKVEEKRTGTI